MSSLVLPLRLPSPPPPLQPLYSKTFHSLSIPSSFHKPIRSPTAKPHAPSRFLHSKRCLVPFAINLTAGNPGDSSRKIDLDGMIDLARNLFDNLPHPIKSYPWAKTLENFFRLVVDLFVAVAKWLSVPILAVSSLTEMSYCAHERKLVLVPIPFLVGLAVAGVLKDTAVELSSDLKEGGYPWHLLVIATFFTLLKLPGPYYPYWGRLLIPHFANGGLWRTVWLAIMWYRGNQNLSGDSKRE